MKTNTLRLLVGLLLTTAVSGKTIPNFADADLVLGQVDFTSMLASASPTAAALDSPTSVIVDPVTRKVFVSDSKGNRILRFASADSLVNGAAAEAVFGQALFTTTNSGMTADQFGGYPISLFLDAKGRLWVPDYAGNRVLRFDLASQRDSSPSADRVYGQPDFTTGTPSTTAVKMNKPYAVCVDSADRLWVADAGNNRVLRFDSITTKPSGAAADGVLGQANFTTLAAGSGSSGLQTPTSVTVSAGGTLFVACYVGNRVMRFDNAAGLANHAPATAVLGQADFTTTILGTTAATMNYPCGAWITPDDSLWVADSGNNRLLRFNNASTKPSGAAAEGLLGQPNFISNLGALTRSGMNTPFARPFVDTTGSVWIADRGNNRVLRFSPDATPPLLVVTAPAKVTKKKLITLKGTASDTYGISKVEYRIGKGPFKRATGTTAWKCKVKLKKGKNLITLRATDVDGIFSPSKTLKITRK